jgi:hypothetical protein
MLRIAIVLSLAIVGAVALGCDAVEDRGQRLDRADEAVNQFLASVRTDAEPDRGWALIAPEIRAEAFSDDRDGYLRLAAAANWSRFRYQVVDAVLDDQTTAFITIHVPGGAQSVPAFLRDSNGWGLVMIGDGDERRAQIGVRLTFDGRVEGIWAGGG